MTTSINSKEIRIILKDGSKESELRLDKIKEEHKLAIIDGFFRFFDVQVDFREMAETYLKTGKAYSDFYSKLSSPEVTENNEAEDLLLIKPNQKSKVKTATDESTDENYEENTYNWTLPIGSTVLEEVPEFTKTGVKERNGVKSYRCRYKCPKCHNQANRYVQPTDKNIRCHECNQIMYIKPSTKEGFPHTDSFSNFFVAGDFEREISMERNETNGDS